MVVPYGFGVGDFLAISNLIYKIGLELKKNPKSAPDYQHLLIELEALDRALRLLQCIKPAQHELRRLEGIRALASTCQRPLEEFLAKIEKFEEHLGSWNASNHQFSGLTRRLQWSMKYKEEVKSLRAKLAPNVATITVLLATQTIDTLSNAESDRFQIARELNCKFSTQCKILADLKQTTLGITTAQARLEAEQSRMTAVAAAQDQDLRTLKSKADELLKDNITHEIHLYNQDAILVDIQGNGTTINSRTQETHILATAIRQDTAEIKAATDSVLGRALDLMSAITAGISKIQDIIALIAQMIRLTTQFTIEMRETMGKLLQAFWDIQRQLARLERFLPKQIDLPVVRFRDAFNEMRSLPYDLSRQWQTFQGLVAVVFMNRQGLHRVNMGQYFVTNVRIGQRLNPICWSNAIEPGDELSMTMILDDIEAEDGFCPYKSCGASTKDVASTRGGKTCPNCFRFAAISQRKQAVPPHYEYTSPKSDLESLLDDSDGSEEFVADAAPVDPPELEVLKKEDIELYHSIQVVQALLTNACDEAGSSKQPSLQTSRDEVSNEPIAVLALLPMNGTFERKQINVPFFPDALRIGRHWNAKTVPTPSNGFFDPKVLSMQHAEVWAERNGKIWIRDVQSSKGTFVNGHRLSPENRDSEPQELHQHDILELGIDIISEDLKVIVHHKVSAKVEYVGIPGSSNNV